MKADEIYTSKTWQRVKPIENTISIIRYENNPINTIPQNGQRILLLM